MASEAQMRANRGNAQKSTGPRTKAGKAKVAGNAVTHGLTARAVHLCADEERAFAALLADLRAAWRPAGAYEDELVRQLAALALRLGRIGAIEAQVLAVHDLENALAAAAPEPAEAGCALGEPGTARAAGARLLSPMLATGRAYLRDCAETSALDRLHRYETSLRRNLRRITAELERARARRTLSGPSQSPGRG